MHTALLHCRQRGADSIQGRSGTREPTPPHHPGRMHMQLPGGHTPRQVTPFLAHASADM